MADFKSLDPDTCCVALVGTFLQQWSFMEAAISRCISKALALDNLQSAIVSANTQTRDKIQIVRTVLSIVAIHPKEDAARFDKILARILDYMPFRNMIAHDMFVPADKGLGVQFFVTKAKGSLRFPEVIWDIEKFDSEFIKISEFTAAIDELESKLEAVNAAKALASSPNPYLPLGFPFGPTAEQGLLAALGRLSLQSQDNPKSDTNPSNPEKGNETPPSSGE
jgi:hypothetical protein